MTMNELPYYYEVNNGELIIKDSNGVVLMTFDESDSDTIEAWLSDVKKRKLLTEELRSSNKLTQIKALRAKFGINLREAKDLLDNLESGFNARMNKKKAEEELEEPVSLGSIFRTIERKYYG
jgi:ribosomal protein L7/L12